MPGAYLWGWTGAAFKEVLVDGSGHLQVDVLSGVGVASQCYGWVAAAWYHLLVQTAANPNLRVTLYDAGSPIFSSASSAVLGGTARGLFTQSGLRAFDATYWRALEMRTRGLDDRPASYYGVHVNSALYGFDGTTWDRLRTYGTGILKVGRAEIGATVAPVSGVGSIVATGCKVFWISCTPDSPSSEWEISDDTDGTTAEVMCHFDSDKHSEVLTFDPPQEFINGVYVKKFDHMKCLHICYKA